jgi:predicted DNA-binding transcriptional regulator AlpA
VLLRASQLAKRFADGPVRFVSAEIDAWLEEQRRAWMPARRRA